MRLSALAVVWTVCALSGVPTKADEFAPRPLIVASSSAPNEKSVAQGNNDTPSPEEQMRRRFPQAVKTGDLVGLPVLDDADSTIGFVSHVARTADGKIQLIVPYSPWLGWASFLASPRWGKRPVAVPIEKVAILGRQIAALEMAREDFDKAPTWTGASAERVPIDETIRIAITRR
jgi:hypothetical protein